MLTLDRVQLLEDRIKKAVSLINRLREENSSLTDQVQILKSHNEELRDFAKNFSHDTELIEMGISKAIAQLDTIEGLDDEIPVEDLNRSAEFSVFDQAGPSGADAASDDQDEDTQRGQDPIIGYEDDDPLI